MLPLLLEIQNFQSHNKTVLNFESLDNVTLIVGENEQDPKRSNGVGKSSLLDAINWVVFNNSRVTGTKSLTIDELVRDGQTEMSVRFTFKASDDNVYRITRSYKKRRTTTPATLTFEIKNNKGWKSLDKDLKKLTQKKIEKIIGFDNKIWECTAFCRQHEIAGIASQDSTSRLALIKQILRLDKYQDFSKKAKENLDILKEQLAEHQLMLDSIKEAKQSLKEKEEKLETQQQKKQVCEHKITLQKKKIEESRTEIDELNKVLGAFEQLNKNLSNSQERKSVLLKENRQFEQQVEQTKIRIEDLKKEHKQKIERQAEIDNNKPDKVKLQNSFKQLSLEKDKAQQKNGSLSGMFDSINEQGKALKKEKESIIRLGIGSCPTCKQEISEQHINKVSEEYEKKLEILRTRAREIKKEQKTEEEKLEKLQEKIEELYKKQDFFNSLIEEKNKIIERLRSIADLVNALQTSLQNTQVQLNVNKQELLKLAQETEQLQKKVDSTKSSNVLEKHKTLATRLRTENSVLEQIQQEYADLKSNINLLQELVKQDKQTIENGQKKKDGIKQIQQDIDLYNVLQKDFAKTIPTMILENLATTIEVEVNKCLATLSDGFLVKINTQHKNKTNDGIKEVFDLQVTVNDSTRPYELLSGGEQFRVAFAIRVALSLILSQEAGVNLECVFYDEPFTDLDEDGLDRIQEIFIYLSSLFRHQIAITHQNRLKEIFNDVITVRKTEEGSTLVN